MKISDKKVIELKYQKYDFTPILGWSISRFEEFDKCKRRYFYSYYPKCVPNVPSYKMQQLKGLTTVALETGNVIHDILEAFLKRLQLSDTNIDEKRFFSYARALVDRYFSEKTFLEIYYKYTTSIEKSAVYDKVQTCLENFLGSPCYSWIYMSAMTSRDNWMIEPDGYGETRLNGLKAYCKMDFLIPVENSIYILDWKTGQKDQFKHRNQLLGYAAAAHQNFGIPWNAIFPKIIYLTPHYDEFEIEIKENDLKSFFEVIKAQTEQMYEFCSSVDDNKPLPIDSFPKNPSPGMCRQCKYQEFCFPQGIKMPGNDMSSSPEDW
jgi:CRISPR/Cas system-associated exonuclease Cas4 (RecB family)